MHRQLLISLRINIVVKRAGVDEKKPRPHTDLNSSAAAREPIKSSSNHRN